MVFSSSIQIGAKWYNRQPFKNLDEFFKRQKIDGRIKKSTMKQGF